MQKGFSGIFLIIFIIALIFAGLAGAYYFGKLPIKHAGNTPKACTQEAKICPDGSSVGRSGPNCEFSPCPTGTKSTPTDSCSEDSECGINICECISQRNELITYKEKSCTRACSGQPKCINKRCILDNTNTEGRYCGGFKEEFNQCPAGYKCEYDGDYPDAGGKCIKE